MKKIIFISFLVLFIKISFSQDNEINYNGFRLGINFSPELAYRNLIVPKQSFHKDTKNIRDNVEQPIFSFTTGIFAEYKFTKRFLLNLGLYYYTRGFKSKSLLGSNYTYPTNSDNENHIYLQKYYCVGVPISVSFYYVSKPKIQAFISLGIGMDYIFKVSLKNTSNNTFFDNYEYASLSKGNPYGYHLFNPTYKASIGIDWQFSKSFSLRVEPIFRSSFRTLLGIDKAILKQYYYNTGVNFSLFYSFLKRESKKQKNKL
jgi:hypothetical protein